MKRENESNDERLNRCPNEGKVLHDTYGAIRSSPENVSLADPSPHLDDMKSWAKRLVKRLCKMEQCECD